MKATHNYILLVDHYRPTKRSTWGRYRVCAKTPEQAVQLLRDAIGFGSIQVYYQCEDNDPNNITYKTVVRETFVSVEKDGHTYITTAHVPPEHFNAPKAKPQS